MSKKAIFFDIDGTIVNDNNEISLSTREAIKKLRNNGHLSFVCTGRAYSAIGDDILNLGFDGIIAGAGTTVHYKEKEIYNNEIDQKTLEYTINVLEEFEIDYMLEGTKNLFTKRETLINPKPYYEVFVNRFRDSAIAIEKISDIHANKFTCCFLPEKVSVMEKFITQNKETYDAIVHEVCETDDIYNPFRNYVVEFVPKGYNKAVGIKKAIDKLEISREDTYAFGDSNNDIEMLSFVNYSVVMGNGTPKAKEVSKYITDNVDEDGIYNGLLKLKLI